VVHMTDPCHVPGGASVARALLLLAFIALSVSAGSPQRVRLADPVLLATIDGLSIGFDTYTKFGSSVATSWDGSTIAVGAPAAANGIHGGAIVVLSRTGGQEWDVTQVIIGDLGSVGFGGTVVMSDDGLTLATTGETLVDNIVTPYLCTRADGQLDFSLIGPVGTPPGFQTGDVVSFALGASQEQGIFVVNDAMYSYIYTWTGTSNGMYRIVDETTTTTQMFSAAMSSDGMWTATCQNNYFASGAGQVNVGLCEPPNQGSQCSVVQQLSDDAGAYLFHVGMTGDSLAIIASTEPNTEHPDAVFGFWRNSTSEMYELVGTLTSGNPSPEATLSTVAVSRNLTGESTYTVVAQLQDGDQITMYSFGESGFSAAQTILQIPPIKEVSIAVSQFGDVLVVGDFAAGVVYVVGLTGPAVSASATPTWYASATASASAAPSNGGGGGGSNSAAAAVPGEIVGGAAAGGAVMGVLLGLGVALWLFRRRLTLATPRLRATALSAEGSSSGGGDRPYSEYSQLGDDDYGGPAAQPADWGFGGRGRGVQ
jgi:hypothetical protein